MVGALGGGVSPQPRRSPGARDRGSNQVNGGGSADSEETHYPQAYVMLGSERLGLDVYNADWRLEGATGSAERTESTSEHPQAKAVASSSA